MEKKVGFPINPMLWNIGNIFVNKSIELKKSNQLNSKLNIYTYASILGESWRMEKNVLSIVYQRGWAQLKER